ncbi:hypothetical protein KHA93_14610 [Bacillus sp. FJAT-49732]|uniref:Uncharacterized protein n=1 Tax=Lederbergia citrisecunda TaxID=2833583 RepID=A0A942TMC8_9BACI|nr:hypothetical protein [Lederbergia citrisecunda]MBS4200865.1 hypothetical protein [Lederbergia citrisecunda]
MTLKKWIYLFLIIVLVVPILFFYNAFNGNPAWKYFSNKAVKHYLQDTYPGEEFVIHDGFYNFKVSGYSYKVRKVGDERQKNYEFTVSGFWKPTVIYDEIYYDNLDLPLIEKLEKEAISELKELLKDKVKRIVDMSVQIEVLKGTYSLDTHWSKDLKLEKPIYIHLIVDATNMSKEDALETVRSIQQALNTDHYSYEGVSFNGNLFDNKTIEKDELGYVKYSVGFEKDSNIELNDIEEYNQ